MSLTTLALEILLVAAGAYGLRQQRHWLFKFAIVVGLAGLALSLARYYATGEVRWFNPWDLVLAPATIAVVAFALATHRRKMSRASGAKFGREL
jgi:ABC-type transport system involved in cytochrome c biogenesis permease subunit